MAPSVVRPLSARKSRLRLAFIVKAVRSVEICVRGCQVNALTPDRKTTHALQAGTGARVAAEIQGIEGGVVLLRCRWNNV